MTLVARLRSHTDAPECALQRINSILNLALYHQVFERAELATLEETVKNKGSMAELREAADLNPTIAAEWEDAMYAHDTR